MPRGSSRRRAAGQTGSTLLEFALALPLFLAVLWGIVAVASYARLVQQAAAVHHAVVREAAADRPGAGRDSAGLTRLAQGYARRVGMPAAARITVEARAGGLSGGPGGVLTGSFGRLAEAFSGSSRITTRVLAPVSVPGERFRRRWRTVLLANTVVAGTWKEPWKLLARVLPVPRTDGRP